MKLKLFTKLWQMSKAFLYIFWVQVAFMATTLANEGISQDLDETFISANWEQTNLAVAFGDIQFQTDYFFSYDKRIIDHFKISFKRQRVSLMDFLMYITRETGLRFKKNEDIIFVKHDPLITSKSRKKIHTIEIPALGLDTQLNTESEKVLFTKKLNTITLDRVLRGVVKDASGNPLIGATIQIKETGQGMTTDIDGSFSISIPDSGELHLVVSYVGFLSQEAIILDQEFLEIVLQESASMLEEVVVVGYGTRKKVDLTGAVSTVGSENLENRPATNVSTALAGQIPGLTVVQKSGRPGANAGTLRIRGIGTLGNSNPLILIDGIEGDLQDVDINDIDNISVLKDASSAAIYGVRAANGVILVTTKRGEGDPVIRYHGGIGTLSPFQIPKRVDAYDYAKLHNAAREVDGQALRYTQEDLDKWKSGNSPSTHPDNDQFESLLNSGDPTRYFHNLSISGSSDATNFYLSFGHNYEGGLIATHGYTRTNYRLNLDQKINNKIDVGVKLAGSIAEIKGNTQSVGQLITEAYRHHPGDVIQFENGLWPVNSRWGGTRNMVAYVSAPLGTNDFFHNDFINSAFAEYKLLNDLKIKGHITATNNNRKQKYFRNFFTHYRYEESSDSYPIAGTISGRIIRRSDITWDITSRLLASYDLSWADQKLSALLGYEQRKVDSEYINAGRSSLRGNNNITQLNGVSDANDFAQGNLTEYRFRSGFGSVNYNLAEKYLFEANLRYDGTTRFPQENKYAFFPSFSVAWRLSEEDFFNSSFIDYLKVRASWGQLGNQEIGNYAFLNVYGVRDNYVFGTINYTGIGESSRLANTEISWETLTSTNIGLNAGILGGKCDITVEYYVKNTNDILLSLPQPLILGAQPPVTNAGSVRNKGFEISINHRNTIGSDFKINLNANIAFVENEITDLKGTDAPGREVGDPIQNIYGYVADGIFQNQTEIESAPDQSFFGNTPVPGDIRYADINGRSSNGELTGEPDGIVNADDRKSIGSYFPTTSFGFTAGFKWKYLDFSMVWQGFAGLDVLTTGPVVRPFNGGARPLKAMLDNFWTSENPGAEYPRLSFTAQGRNYQRSTYWMQNGAFAKLRNMQVGFTLNNLNAAKSVQIQKVRIYASGENLLHISGFKNIDPEFAHGNPFAWNDSNYPSARLFLAGINITF